MNAILIYFTLGKHHFWIKETLNIKHPISYKQVNSFRSPEYNQTTWGRSACSLQSRTRSKRVGGTTNFHFANFLTSIPYSFKIAINPLWYLSESVILFIRFPVTRKRNKWKSIDIVDKMAIIQYEISQKKFIFNTLGTFRSSVLPTLS